MNIQEMKEKKKEKGYTNEQIAELSGVPLGTVQKIFGGATTSPRYDTLKALEKIFLPMERERYYASVVKDASAAYTVKRQGEYTVEDYYALPDEQRAELIDGVLYDMASPETLHQMVGGYIYARFLEFISKNKGNCIPLIAPLDVQLDCDEAAEDYLEEQRLAAMRRLEEGDESEDDAKDKDKSKEKAEEAPESEEVYFTSTEDDE